MLTPEQKKELDAIREQNGGLTPPAKVVEFARDPNTALHSRFTWDDTEAAEQYRLWEARQVVSVYVYTPEGSKEPIRAYVSFPEDRHADGGYRYVPDVLKDPGLRSKMIAQALSELAVFQRKYRQLSELDSVFSEAEKARQKHEGNGKPHANGKPATNVKPRKNAVAVG